MIISYRHKKRHMLGGKVQGELNQWYILTVLSISYRYQELLESHNHDSFLHLMPAGQHKQDEKVADYDMGKRINQKTQQHAYI